MLTREVRVLQFVSLIVLSQLVRTMFLLVEVVGNSMRIQQTQVLGIILQMKEENAPLTLQILVWISLMICVLLHIS